MVFLLFETCRIGFYLVYNEGYAAKNILLFVWGERETGMRCWTDESSSSRDNNNNSRDLSSKDIDSSEPYLIILPRLSKKLYQLNNVDTSVMVW
ncbi:1114_t:CDS:2 [Entrophospora sp. SA101]|nr:1114_t:CDS:2 [Entrophospora sp. SA101]